MSGFFNVVEQAVTVGEAVKNSQAFGLLVKVANLDTTKVLLGPVYKDLPDAYSNFNQGHQEARNVTKISIGLVSAIAGIICSFLWPDFRAFLVWVAPFIEASTNASYFFYPYTGYLVSTYFSTGVGDAAWVGYFTYEYRDSVFPFIKKTIGTIATELEEDPTIFAQDVATITQIAKDPSLPYQKPAENLMKTMINNQDPTQVKTAISNFSAILDAHAQTSPAPQTFQHKLAMNAARRPSIEAPLLTPVLTQPPRNSSTPVAALV